MSGRLLRAVCATAVLAAVAARAPSGAAPDPRPAPEPPEVSAKESPRPKRSVGPSPTPSPTPSPAPSPTPSPGVTVDASEALAGRTPSATATPSPAKEKEDDAPAGTGDPSDVPDATPLSAPDATPALLTELRTLYRQMEQATEKFNAADEKLRRQTAATRTVNDRLTRARRTLGSGRADAGRLAREQYRDRSDFSAYLRLLLADGPSGVFDQSHVIDRAAAGRAATVDRLTKAEKRAGVLAAAARKALAEQRALAAEQRRRRDSVRTALDGVEARLAGLTPAQLGAVSALEDDEVDAAQQDLVASGALGSTRPPSGQGAEAVAYAIEQIGKEYEWGAEGPDTFDCSGLTMRAWEHAGLAVPRTSQEQWAGLPRVPVSSLRPGDLVVYYPEATHVALYIGDGLVVQAPRPGAVVKVSPLASNPLLGAVRPDPEGVPLTTYVRPELPEGASEGSDTGYDASVEPPEQ
ncbi:C40 family peptidase [Streptomyces sp. NBC_00102]|uniref:C40 family peptidase n=1 Tax=Streptomyces sp. NBC_00102 TaxID=2975652 RepID=UPI00225683C2|nr:C40 family peptidase [Streptomyces sp. NBC_00102]MCX5399726.1 NlpC/P60 family protein [Streptomyces sp. NBC_00102]